MNPGEHEIMARVEAEHWWYRGLRDLLARTIRDPAFGLGRGARVLDAGCGTGENLRLIAGLLEPAYLGGFDLAEEALDWARRKSERADLYRSDIRSPELRADRLDLVVSCDVLCIPGREASRAGVARLASALRPGGLFVLHLPAFDWLKSEHDEAVHTTDRFTARQVRELLDAAGLTVARLSYRVCLLFPVVVLARLPRLFAARRGGRAVRSDLARYRPSRLDAGLLALLRWENARIAAGRRLPWGSSVFAVGVKG